MLKPTFRLFIVPLGAVCTIAALASQNAPQTTQRDAFPTQVRQEITSCGSGNVNADICVISEITTR